MRNINYQLNFIVYSTTIQLMKKTDSIIIPDVNHTSEKINENQNPQLSSMKKK